MPSLSVFAGLFFELACRVFPIVIAVVSAGACDRLAVELYTPEIKFGIGLQSACNWLSALDPVPESEAEAWVVAVSETGVAGL